MVDKIGKIIKIVEKIVPPLLDIFKRCSKKAAQTESIRDNSSLENIEHITQIFAEIKEEMYTKAAELENAAAEEVAYYAEELHDILESNADKVAKYNIKLKRIERDIDKISSRVKGTIDNELLKKVSLDDRECRAICEMIPGAKKESKWNAFVDTAVKEALAVYCSELRSSLEEIYENVESEVVDAVESIQRQTKDLQEKLALIDGNNDEVTAKNHIIVDAYYVTDVCNIVDTIL